MFRDLLTIGCLLLAGAVPAQNRPSDPDVNAITRIVSTEIVYNSPTSAVETNTQTTTLLNVSAKNKAFFSCYTDGKQKLISFSGTIWDAKGNILRKLKRSDLKYSELSLSNLADDTGYYTLDFTPAAYPCTFTITYEMVHKDAILGFTPFVPLNEIGTSLEQGSYKLTVPQGTTVYYKNLNTDIDPEIETIAGKDVYSWKMNNLPAIRDEEHAPPGIDLIPIVHIVPEKFIFGNSAGEMKNWDTFGRWLWSVWAGRDVLPKELKAEVHKRTDSLNTDFEKISALYDYLAETTRYVSIQLGIGGLQPMPAAEVFRTKFGDCKALTNYMMSMLRECGIRSDFAIIHSRNRHMLDNFASAGQADHAILRVPLDADTLWLECTNPKLPIGYVHPSIAGHDAVYFADGTGHFTTLPSYADSLNLRTRQIDVTIAQDGSAEAVINENSHLHYYYERLRFQRADTRARKAMLQGDNTLPHTTIDSIAITEHKSPLPVMELSYRMKTPQYGNLTGRRFFIPQNPFSECERIREKTRTYDLYFPFGHIEHTVLVLHLPKNMEVETLPHDISFEAPFGHFTTHVSAEGDTIRIEFRHALRSGTFSKELFEQYKQFSESFADACKANIVLKKTE